MDVLTNAQEMENATCKVFVSVLTDFLVVIAPFFCAPPAMRSATWQKLPTRLTKMQSVVEGELASLVLVGVTLASLARLAKERNVT